MKKIILSTFIFFLLLVPFVSLYGNGDGNGEIGTELTIPTGSGEGLAGEVIGVFMKVANWAFSILMVVAVIGVVISGFLFVTSAGDATKLKQARDLVIYSLIGALVGSLGIVLVTWVRNLIEID